MAQHALLVAVDRASKNRTIPENQVSDPIPMPGRILTPID
jgi:hypothetical protein